jgi:hypothetical protein
VPESNLAPHDVPWTRKYPSFPHQWPQTLPWASGATNRCFAVKQKRENDVSEAKLQRETPRHLHLAVLKRVARCFTNEPPHPYTLPHMFVVLLPQRLASHHTEFILSLSLSLTSMKFSFVTFTIVTAMNNYSNQPLHRLVS